MYRILKIGGKDYKLEYSIEASLYDECTERLIDFIGKTSSPANENELTDGKTESEKIQIRQALFKNSISGMSNLPKTALTIFFAGLLEHHGPGKRADNTVMSIEDAKDLVRQYFEDHAEDGTDNYYDLLLICMEQMGEDGFFARTGLEKMIGTAQQENTKRQTKKPQDHKKAGDK